MEILEKLVVKHENDNYGEYTVGPKARRVKNHFGVNTEEPRFRDLSGVRIEQVESSLTRVLLEGIVEYYVVLQNDEEVPEKWVGEKN